MTLHVGLAANTVSADAPDVRLALAGLVVRDGNGLARSGFFPNRSVTATVTGRTDMSVDIGYFNAAIALTTASGPLFFGNDGTVTSAALAAAPSSNSRYDLLYVQHTVSSAPVFGVVTGTASSTPVVPTLPANSIAIATILVPSTATTTSSSGVVINEVFPYTGPTGSPIWMRTQAERDAAGLSFGQQVRRLDMGNWVEENMPARSSGGSMDPGRAAGWYPVTGRMPSAETVMATGQSVPASADTTLLGYAGSDRSVFGGFSYSGSGLFAAPFGGRYMVAASCNWSTTAGGKRQLAVLSGGGKVEGRSTTVPDTGNSTPVNNVSAEVVLATGANIYLSGYQTSSATLTATVTSFTIRYLGPN